MSINRLVPLFTALIFVGVITTSCEGLGDSVLDGELTEAEVIAGLKEALSHGTDTAASRLSATDGYFKDEVVKILLPEEAQVVYDRIGSVPLLGGFVDETVLTINRAAEDAAVEAKPIFVDAVKEITIEDGFDILYGEDTAATSYLRGKTYSKLFAAFQPKIKTSLSKKIVLGMSAEESYDNLISAYNTASLNGLLFDKISTNSLSEHTTNRALRGMFIKVGDEEKMIRENPAHRVTEILERVFGELD